MKNTSRTWALAIVSLTIPMLAIAVHAAVPDTVLVEGVLHASGHILNVNSEALRRAARLEPGDIIRGTSQ